VDVRTGVEVDVEVSVPVVESEKDGSMSVAVAVGVTVPVPVAVAQAVTIDTEVTVAAKCFVVLWKFELIGSENISLLMVTVSAATVSKVARTTSAMAKT
jgi:hypothetical protein